MKRSEQEYIFQLPRANDSIVLYSVLPIHYYLDNTRCLDHIRHLDHLRHLDHRRHLDEKSKRSEPLRMLTSGTLQPSKWIAETTIDPCSIFFFSILFSCMLQVGVAEDAPYPQRQVVVRFTVLSRMHLESLQAYKSRFWPLGQNLTTVPRVP